MSGGDMLLGATARPNGVLTELLAVRSGIDVAVDDGFLVMTDTSALGFHCARRASRRR